MLTLKFTTWLLCKDTTQKDGPGSGDVGVGESDDIQLRWPGFEEHERRPGGHASEGQREAWAGDDP